jgi:hypothetical protein
MTNAAMMAEVFPAICNVFVGAWERIPQALPPTVILCFTAFAI